MRSRACVAHGLRTDVVSVHRVPRLAQGPGGPKASGYRFIDGRQRLAQRAAAAPCDPSAVLIAVIIASRDGWSIGAVASSVCPGVIDFSTDIALVGTRALKVIVLDEGENVDDLRLDVGVWGVCGLVLILLL